MTSTFDKDTERWEVSHDIYPITVKGPTRSGCEERLADLADRYHQLFLDDCYV